MAPPTELEIPLVEGEITKVHFADNGQITQIDLRACFPPDSVYGDARIKFELTEARAFRELDDPSVAVVDPPARPKVVVCRVV